MFELPDAKRVRRSDLYAAHSSASSSSPPPSEPDPETAAQLRARLAELYGGTKLSPAPDAGRKALEEAEAPAVEEEEFEFRLFRNEAEGDGVELQKIVLRDEEEDLGEGGFVKLRDPRVFTVGRAEGGRRKGLELMAVTGEDVFHASGKRAWGLEVPWRVKVIRLVGKREPKDGKAVLEVEQGGEAKKKRPGKKRRIILRLRKKTKDETAERENAEKLSKEEAEREKKTRRNREKKVKRRLKEKEEKSKKAGGSVDDGNNVNAEANVISTSNIDD